MFGLASGLTSVLSAVGPTRHEEIWGDGFSSDTLSDLVSVCDWEDVAKDEYIRIFPRLLGTWPAKLTSHIEDAVSSLRAQMESLSSTKDCQASLPKRVATRRKSGHSSEAYVECLVPGDLVGLSALSDAMQVGTIPIYDPDLAERVAFLAALHPAYLWPEAMTSHQLYASAGWLGVFMRGRPAILPRDVAEYFVEAITPSTGHSLSVHRSLERRIGSGRRAQSLLLAARERLRGRERTLRFGSFSQHSELNLCGEW